MNRNRVTATAAALVMSSVFAMPVLAQDGHHGDGQRSGGRPHADGQARPENRAPEQHAAPRANVPPQVTRPQSISPRFSGVPRGQAVPRDNSRFERRTENPRAPVAPRFAQPRVIPPQQRFDQRFDQRRFDQRGFDQRRFDQRRFDDRRYSRPRVIRPGIVLSRPYYQPYYTFRPRFSLGFGLWAGYPVLYSNYGPYYAPYPYTGAYPATTYPVPAPGTVAPVASGGLSFDITPPDAEVYIDGEYVGAVNEFAPNEQPLTLTPGRHRVEVDAPGYQALSFDTDILPGQVIPYQGAMQPR